MQLQFYSTIKQFAQFCLNRLPKKVLKSTIPQKIKFFNMNVFLPNFRAMAWLKRGITCLTLAVALLCSLVAQAQVDVTATAGTLGPTTYTTLKGAFDAINAGTHQGDITVNISANTTETATAALNASAAPASYTSVLVQPTAVATVSGNIVGAIIKLNGADNVTIDGRIAGAGRNLSVINTSTNSATAAIWLSSLGVGLGCTNNTVRNLELACGVTQNTATSSTFGIIMSGATISATNNGDDNDNNTFTANRIIRCRYGIVTRGVATNNNQNIVVTNNIVGPTAFGADQIGKVGIFMQADNLSTVSGNTVQFVGGTYANNASGSDRVGIAIGTESWSMTPSTITSGNYTVTGNLIHDIIDEKTYSAVGLLLGTTGGGSPTNNFVCSNMIYNVKANGTVSDQTVGLGISGGHTDYVVNNSIYLYGDVDPDPLASNTSTFGSGIRIANVNGTNHLNLTLKNNVVHMDLFSSSSPTVRYYAISGNSSAYSFGTGGENYNDYYINPANTQLQTGGLGGLSGATLTTQFATLANWQTAYTAAQDANSVQVDPAFTSTTNLHIASPTGGINDLGTPVTCSLDYDGEARSATTPDMGADEVVLCAAAAGGTITPATQTKCAGQTASMTAIGAEVGAGIVYQWEVSTTGGGVGFANVAGGTGAASTSYTTAALAAGTYYYRLKVTCTLASITGYSNELVVTVNPVPTAAAASNSPVCAGTALNLTSTTDIGTTFTWSGPSTYSSTVQNPTIDPVALSNAGAYTVTVSTAVGCSVTASTAVVVNPSPVITSTTATPATICSGGTSQLQVNLQTPTYCTASATTGCSGGDEYISNVTFGSINNTTTCGTTTYSDFTAQSTNVTAGSTGLTLTYGNPNNFSGDQYKVWIDWNQNGLFTDVGEEYTGTGTNLITFSINVPVNAINGSTRMRVRLTFTGVMAPCGISPYGETEDYTVNVSGGVDAYTYAWSPTTYLDNATIANPLATAVMATTAYTVTVTGSNGCFSTGTTTVTVDTPTTSATTTDNTACVAPYTGTATLTTDGVSFLWSNGATTPNLSNLAGGTYTVTVTSSNGCTATASATVMDMPAIPTASATTTDNIACTAPYTGTATLTTDGVAFAWSNGATTQNLSDLAGGTYYVTITSSNGCTSTTSATVMDIPFLPTVIATGTNNTSCTAPIGTATLATDGVAFAWSNGATTQNLSDLAGGTYTVTVTGSNGCTTTASATVVDLPAVPMAGITNNTGTNTLTCATTSISLTATGGGTYLWSGGLTTANRTITAAGTYTVTVTGTNGCTASASIVITQNTALPVSSISASATAITCATPSIVLTATGGGTYAWSTGATTVSITITAAGTYGVTVTGANGCSVKRSRTVTASTAPPTATISGATTLCAGASLSLTASSTGATYAWSGPSGYTATGLTITRNPATAAMSGTYAVTITGSNGCTASASTVVTVNTCTTLAATATGTANTGTNNGTITINTSGGTACAGGTYNYTWSGVSSGSGSGTSPFVISPLATGWYYITVTDCNGGSVALTYYVASQTRTRTKTNDIFEGLTAYPNPASEVTTVAFTTWASERMTVAIYSLDGKQVATLFDGVTIAAADYQLPLEVVDIPAGIYHVLLSTQSGKRETLRIVVVK
jgi:hypothetical protein